MLKVKTILSLLLCSLTAVTGRLSAQDAPDAGDYLTEAKSYASIYSGKEGYRYPRYLLNHPYWDDGGYREGSVLYDGVGYAGVLIRLDLYRDELLLSSPDRRFEVALHAAGLDHALAPPYYIAWMGGEEAGLTQEGYYIRLYDGSGCQVWKRETKRIAQTQNLYSNVLDTYFESRVVFYVFKDGAYHAVKSEASLLKLFPDKKKELRQYARLMGLSFKKTPEKLIVDLVGQYEQPDTENL
ncbi:MAG: hypothetical protein LBK65_09505 [Tannerellaceae bacterium]|jgi:hypothetical protein|nr:hypothetical protein [Tannerellaceae bacterium]